MAIFHETLRRAAAAREHHPGFDFLLDNERLECESTPSGREFALVVIRVTPRDSIAATVPDCDVRLLTVHAELVLISGLAVDTNITIVTSSLVLDCLYVGFAYCKYNDILFPASHVS